MARQKLGERMEITDWTGWPIRQRKDGDAEKPLIELDLGYYNLVPGF